MVKTIKARSGDEQRWAERYSFILGGKVISLNKGLNGDEAGHMDL